MNNIFQLAYKLRFVYRWSGLDCHRIEDVAQHSYTVAVITHLLCEIKNNLFHGNINIEEALIYALYHDLTDSILTHIISPVKNNTSIADGYIKLKEDTMHKIINSVPESLNHIKPNVFGVSVSEHILHMVETADKIDAYLKCKYELEKGNKEFKILYEKHHAIITGLINTDPAVKEFFNFIDSLCVYED